MNKLAEICAAKRNHIAKQKGKISFSALAEIAAGQGQVRGFEKALLEKQKNGVFGLIAEVKKASPSKGLIRADFNPAEIARAYESGGAACLSVLTDEPYFQGADEYLKQARAAVSLPVLRKDFMLDTYQMAESRALGADCILLIMAALSNSQAAELESAAYEFGMDVLVEVHDAPEAENALKHLKSNMIGVNNRSLKTLEVSLQTAKELANIIPANRHKVCESGIFTNQDLKEMSKFGYNSFLVGESLMRQDDIKTAVIKLLA